MGWMDEEKLCQRHLEARKSEHHSCNHKLWRMLLYSKQRSHECLNVHHLFGKAPGESVELGA